MPSLSCLCFWPCSAACIYCIWQELGGVSLYFCTLPQLKSFFSQQNSSAKDCGYSRGSGDSGYKGRCRQSSEFWGNRRGCRMEMFSVPHVIFCP
ncbi:hypothetical protein Nmel_005370 [Mimus melanotis]